MNHQPLRSTDIRERNEKLILRLIYSRQGVSQSETAQITGLKPPTVFRIFSTLEHKHYIKTVELQKDPLDKKGRKPVYYIVNPSVLYAVGVDFWARSAAVLVVDFGGNPVHTEVEDFPADISASSAVDRLVEAIRRSVKASGIDPVRILGIGVGAPGRVNIDKGTVLSYARIKGMENFPVGEILQERLQIPVYVHNNCSVIAMSEYRYGTAAGVRSLLTLLIRSGVGGALIQDGRILISRNTTTLEAGHMTVEPDGLECKCGARGCLEAYLSEEAVIEAALGPNKGRRKPSILDVGISIEKNDAATLNRLEKVVGFLTIGLRNLIHLMNPDAILIVARSHVVAGFLVEAAGKSIKGMRESGDEVKLLSAEYNPILTGRSAADLVFDRFFEA
jgi:N-acetylglucosamine repressor